MNKWIKILLVILGFALVSVFIFLILKSLGITDMNTIKQIILKSKQYSLIVYTLISALLLTTLCFVPLLNSALIVLGIVLFGPLPTFITCLIANFISGTALFFIGDKFGERVATKLITKEELEHAQDLIDKKSKFLLPILFLIPAIPDEALCLVAGMTKMKYWYLIIVNLIYHALEIGMFCFFGSDLINWSSLTFLDWFLFVNIIIVDVYILCSLEKKIKK